MNKLIGATVLLSLVSGTHAAHALSWTQVGGRAVTTPGSLAANATDAWVIGTNSFGADGNQVYQWDGVTWAGQSGAAIQISVPSDSFCNEPWAITSSPVPGQGPIKKWNGSGFVVPPNGAGCARSIAVGPHTGPSAYVWVIGCDPPPNPGYSDRTIYRYSPSTGWQQVPTGAATQIAVDADGEPWVMNSVGNVYHGSVGSDGWPHWVYFGPGGGTYLAAGAILPWNDGAWAALLGGDKHVYRWSWNSLLWVDQGAGNPDFIQISSYVYGYWAIDLNGGIWTSDSL